MDGIPLLDGEYLARISRQGDGSWPGAACMSIFPVDQNTGQVDPPCVRLLVCSVTWLERRRGLTMERKIMNALAAWETRIRARWAEAEGMERRVRDARAARGREDNALG